MKTLTSLATAGIAAVLCLAAAPSFTSTPVTNEGPSVVRADVEPAYVHVESPWGFWGWYWVLPGRNVLECTGTGLDFIYTY
ncbi:MAG: hypothetical protein ACF8XB_19380 [Planctomycetota bacterium JB042]